MVFYRSSRWQMFFKIGVLKSFTYWTHFLITLQAFFYTTPMVAVSGFSRQQIVFFTESGIIADNRTGFYSGLLWKHELNLTSSHWSCSIKEGVLRNFAYLTGKHPCWSIFLIELQPFRSATLLKRDSNTDVSQWNLRNF